MHFKPLPDFSERRAFVEGLALGNRLPELLDRQARRSTTDATLIYLLLWLYWPEISKLNSVREVAGALEPFFAENKNLAGAAAAPVDADIAAFPVRISVLTRRMIVLIALSRNGIL